MDLGGHSQTKEQPKVNLYELWGGATRCERAEDRTFMIYFEQVARHEPYPKIGNENNMEFGATSHGAFRGPRRSVTFRPILFPFAFRRSVTVPFRSGHGARAHQRLGRYKTTLFPDCNVKVTVVYELLVCYISVTGSF